MLLIDRSLTPEEFLKLDSSDLASESLIKERRQGEMRGMDAKRSDWENEEVKKLGEKFKGIFKCESCGSMKTGFIQVQVDRADEPMHCFIFCYDCKARFTKN